MKKIYSTATENTRKGRGEHIEPFTITEIITPLFLLCKKNYYDKEYDFFTSFNIKECYYKIWLIRLLISIIRRYDEIVINGSIIYVGNYYYENEKVLRNRLNKFSEHFYIFNEKELNSYLRKKKIKKLLNEK